MNQRYEQSAQLDIQEVGLSSKEKKKLRIEQRKANLAAIKEKIKRGETYGDIKVSRRIPKEIALAVQERDRGRDFGRPHHICKHPGPPHHIVYFKHFLHGETEGSPHTMKNLESPCSDCHKLAHEMNIPSGTSIEVFFRSKFKNLS